MKKKTIAVLLFALLMFSSLSALAASVEGDWQGSAKVSGVPFSLSLNVSFSADGTFSASTMGLKASGWYSESDGALTVTLGTLDGFLASQLASAQDIGSVSVPITLSDDTLAVSAEAKGLSGSVELKRK